MPLVFASVFTLLLLGVMLGSVIVTTFVFASESAASLPLVLGLIVLMNFVFWLLGPWFTDLIQRWTYNLSPLSLDELAASQPQCKALLEQVTEKYGFKVPKLYLIHDQNPTAYTYGSGRFNARIVISEGLFHYLDDAEAATVIAHELGHITRRDFIVMSIASTLLQCLYALYKGFTRSNRKNNSKGGGKLAAIGFGAYLLYLLGQYVVLYLSRTREYGADEFAVRETGNPNGLSTALMKIAYGIAIESKKPGDKGLIKGTQSLGISSLKNADQISSLGQAEDESNFSLPSLPILSRIMAFDFVSVWAALAEFSSTHPLTGKRVRRINTLCQDFGQQPLVDFSIIEQDIQAHKADARGAFMRDLLVMIWPMLALISIVVGFVLGEDLVMIAGLITFGFTGLYKIYYKYPRLGSQSQPTDYLDLMQDFTASPVRGTPAFMNGTVVGRGVAGSYFSEDFLLHTRTGIVFANYQSWFPVLGNFFAAFFGKIKKLIAAQATVQSSGWFFRSNTQRIDLCRVTPDDQAISAFSSHPILGSVIWHLLLTGLLTMFIVGVINNPEFGTFRESFFDQESTQGVSRDVSSSSVSAE